MKNQHAFNGAEFGAHDLQVLHNNALSDKVVDGMLGFDVALVFTARRRTFQLYGGGGKQLVSCHATVLFCLSSRRRVGQQPDELALIERSPGRPVWTAGTGLRSTRCCCAGPLRLDDSGCACVFSTQQPR